MSASKQYLHFTLGPVQGFVSQARRTRDFWAGSFLLSWLTAHAMKAVQDVGGKIVMPSVDDDELLKAVKGEEVEEFPKIGSLPNNFIAEVSDGFDGNIASQAVQDAWKALADKVWEKDSLADTGVSRELWDSQIGNFWDMAWVISSSDDAGVLAQRKNWRSYMPPETAGDKCTMMGEWQELSGADRPNPRQQAKFWKKINDDKGLDLRENERLCAIAYVKRRFVHAWQNLEINAVKPHKDWKLDANVPSVSYMAAVHWLEDVMTKANEADIQGFHDAARGLNVDYGEWSTDIECINKVIGQSSLNRRFASLDDRMFFEAELEKQEFASLKDSMKKLKDSVGVPSPFYAILMMDGDSLGETKKALADANQSATALSEALAVFTKSVPDVVSKHNGFLIYAGGDDVLAILPLEDALPCAKACRDAYFKAFEGKLPSDKKATICAAIEYAHMKLPLTMILKDAHALLDDVAKDATGRDAVGCRVWKPGGLQQTWAMPWNHAIEDEKLVIATLAKKLGKDEAGEPGYASKFLYHMRETLTMLDGDQSLDTKVIEDVLVADYIGSGLLDGVEDKKKAAKGLIKPLLRQCRAFKHKEDTGRLSADGALLLRFLAQKGVER